MHLWHAVSIDERRAFFRQNLMQKDSDRPDQQFHERWFPGDHSDIGGGYPKSEGGLWRCSFEWILRGAYDAGLILDRTAFDQVMLGGPEEPWAEKKHDMLIEMPRWRLAEYLPKKRCDYRTKTWQRSSNCARPRFIPQDAVIDNSAARRIRKPGTDYGPPNFSREFIADIVHRPAVPDGLTFTWCVPPEPTDVSEPTGRKQWPPPENER